MLQVGAANDMGLCSQIYLCSSSIHLPEIQRLVQSVHQVSKEFGTLSCWIVLLMQIYIYIYIYITYPHVCWLLIFIVSCYLRIFLGLSPRISFFVINSSGQSPPWKGWFKPAYKMGPQLLELCGPKLSYHKSTIDFTRNRIFFLVKNQLNQLDHPFSDGH